MTKDDLIQNLKSAFNEGSLLTTKHDPYCLNSPWNNYRTVVSHEVADRLYEFIDVGMDKVFHYYNADRNHSPDYFEILPDSSFNFASSGVTAYSTEPHKGFNRIIAISSKKKGWHLFGEDENIIQQKIISGQLLNKKELK